MTRIAILSLIACSLHAQAPATGTTPKKTAAAKKAATAPIIPLPSEPGEYAIFTTSMGRIVVQLFEKEAPVTVRNFVSLARGTREWTDPKTKQKVKRPFYNGLTFHRVIPGFMIQGGDPTGTGMGDGGVPTIIDEFDPSLKFDKTGRLAMANTGAPHTGGVQFFITDGTPEHLNGKHTIFGQVVEGQDIVEQIARVPRDSNDRPRTPVVIRSLLIRRVGPAPAAPASPARKTGMVKKSKS